MIINEYLKNNSRNQKKFYLWYKVILYQYLLNMYHMIFMIRILCITNHLTALPVSALLSNAVENRNNNGKCLKKLRQVEKHAKFFQKSPWDILFFLEKSTVFSIIK